MGSRPDLLPAMAGWLDAFKLRPPFEKLEYRSTKRLKVRLKTRLVLSGLQPGRNATLGFAKTRRLIFNT
jgi:hypothetical protein